MEINQSISTNGSTGHLDDDRSLGEIMRDTVNHAQDLVKGEIELFKDEMQEKMAVQGKAAAFGVGAAVFAVVALILAGHLLAQVFNTFLPVWAAYLIVTAIYGGAAAYLGIKAKEIFESTPIAPVKSVESAKEDIEWVKNHK